MKLLNKAKKSLGQNFLIDKNVINKIVKIGNIDKSKTTIEIGAGYGDLTNAISMEKPNKIFAIEKDKKISHFLKEKFKNYKNIEIINRDILNLIEKNNFGKNIMLPKIAFQILGTSKLHLGIQDPGSRKFSSPAWDAGI